MTNEQNRVRDLFFDAMFVVGFSLYCSFLISMMSLPSFLGYHYLSVELEGRTSLLIFCFALILSIIFGYTNKKAKAKVSGAALFKKIYIVFFVVNICTLIVVYSLSFFPFFNVSISYFVIALQYALLFIQLTALWARACETLTEKKMRFHLPLAMLLSAFVGILAHYLSITLRFPEGVLSLLLPFISSAFLLAYLLKIPRAQEEGTWRENRVRERICPRTNQTREKIYFQAIWATAVKALRNPGFLAIGILFIYILCSGVFYSVLTQGMQNYSLQGITHKVIVVAFTTSIFLFLQFPRYKKNRRFTIINGIVYFIPLCIIALYCIAIFGASLSTIAREIVLPTRACSLFLLWMIIAELSRREGFSFPKLAVGICLPTIFLSRAIMFDAWLFWNDASVFVPSDTLMLALVLISAFTIMVGTFQLLLASGRKKPPENGTNVLALQEAFGLSQREAEVVDFISRGYTKKKIAEILFLSVNSVSTYTKSAYTKLGVHNRQEVIDLAKEYSVGNVETG